MKNHLPNNICLETFKPINLLSILHSVILGHTASFSCQIHPKFFLRPQFWAIALCHCTSQLFAISLLLAFSIRIFTLYPFKEEAIWTVLQSSIVLLFFISFYLTRSIYHNVITTAYQKYENSYFWLRSRFFAKVFHFSHNVLEDTWNFYTVEAPKCWNLIIFGWKLSYLATPGNCLMEMARWSFKSCLLLFKLAKKKVEKRNLTQNSKVELNDIWMR